MADKPPVALIVLLYFGAVVFLWATWQTTPPYPGGEGFWTSQNMPAPVLFCGALVCFLGLSWMLVSTIRVKRSR